MLMSLSKSFKTFRLNYIMSKRSYTLAELLNELKVAEGINSQRKTASGGERFYFCFYKEGKEEEKGSKIGCTI